MLKKRIQALPPKFKTVVGKFPLTKPDNTVPAFIMDRAYNSSDKEFNLEINENEQFDIAEWAFELSGQTLPDEMEGVSDYTSKISEFATIIIMKLFALKYENDVLKPCDLYQKNEKIVPVTLKERKKLNKQCENAVDEQEKGLFYARHYGVEAEFEELNKFEQKLFFHYCYENDAKNTMVGKK